MPEDNTTKDLATVWKGQPDETPFNLERLMNRRTRELDTATRAEILTGLGAALFFVAIMVWREPYLMKDPMSRPGLAAVVAWVLISLYWFRDRIWSEAPQRKDALAVPGLKYYRTSIERRRDHLRNAWLWHGPLFLACAILTAMLIWKRIIAYRRLQTVLPLILLLAAWTVFGVVRRRRQANELQREIDEIERG
jgi:hypothetical protein